MNHFSDFKVSPLEETVTLDNGEIKATFNAQSGFLKTITPKGKAATDINLQFVSYGARGHRSREFLENLNIRDELCYSHIRTAFV